MAKQRKMPLGEFLAAGPGPGMGMDEDLALALALSASEATAADASADVPDVFAPAAAAAPPTSSTLSGGGDGGGGGGDDDGDDNGDDGWSEWDEAGIRMRVRMGGGRRKRAPLLRGYAGRVHQRVIDGVSLSVLDQELAAVAEQEFDPDAADAFWAESPEEAEEGRSMIRAALVRRAALELDTDPDFSHLGVIEPASHAVDPISHTTSAIKLLRRSVLNQLFSQIGQYEVASIRQAPISATAFRAFVANLRSGTMTIHAAWHGTQIDRLPAIYDAGLIAGGSRGVKVRNGAVHGHGVYCGTHLSVSLAYSSVVAREFRTVLACAVIPNNLHRPNPQMIVAKSANHVLPLFAVTVGRKLTTDSMQRFMCRVQSRHAGIPYSPMVSMHSKARYVKARRHDAEQTRERRIDRAAAAVLNCQPLVSPSAFGLLSPSPLAAHSAGRPAFVDAAPDHPGPTTGPAGPAAAPAAAPDADTLVIDDGDGVTVEYRGFGLATGAE